MKKINIILGVLFIGALMNSCTKSTAESPNIYSIRMTDAPGPYSAVNIDLQGVEIMGSDGKAVTMNVNAGIYNLLNFTNGLDTLIARDTFEFTEVKQIRLILGSNNTVVVNNTTYPLSTPSAEQSGLKLQVNHTMQAGVNYEVLLDFDASKSIVETGNGTYKLKPVLRTIDLSISGAIKGNINPIGLLASVSVSSADTFSTNVNAKGEFLIKGLPAGTYSVTVTPVIPFLPITLNNIVVTTGNTASVGTVVF
ncbi:MAG: DUF4382 domain-containing protein [Bacteroidetes bacterium]|nr:DUF4382 domain-containing protein [Bacteroidota bacterium]